MKRTLLFTALLIMGSINAQEDQKKISIEKGIWTLGGSLNLSTNSFDSQQEESLSDRETENFSFNFFPRFGYAIADNLVVALSIGYGLNKSDSENFNGVDDNTNSEFKRETISVIPNIRAYKTLGKSFALYLQGEFGYSKNWGENTFSDGERRTFDGESFFVGFRPGASFFISKNFAFESSLGLLRYNTTKNSESDGFSRESNTLLFDLSPSSINFGLNFFF